MNITAFERPTADAMTIDEIAAEFGVDRNLVLRRIRDGALKPLNQKNSPFAKRVRIYWVSRAEVERFVQQAS